MVAPLQAQAAPLTERVTEYGTVIGLETANETLAWLGIPFAQPPVGDLRWAAPADPMPWSAPLQTDTFPDACMQNGTLYGPGANNQYDETIGTTLGTPLGAEDCLYLNIWRPATTEQDLPVLFFIHGGSSISGYTADPIYDGAALASSANAVVVTVQYRLGIFGFLDLPALKDGATPEEASGNFALLDLIAALEFVRDNIGAFGGSPDNVTIMGQSAGGILTWELLVSPLSEGLFHRAVPLSAGLAQEGYSATTLIASAETARAAAEELLYRRLVADGIAPDLDSAGEAAAAQTDLAGYLRGQDAAVLLETWRSASNRASGIIPDGLVVPAHPLQAVRDGLYHRVPLLVGYTAEESKLFLGVQAGEDGFILPSQSELFALIYAYDPDAPTLTVEDILKPDYLPVGRFFTGWNSVNSLAMQAAIYPMRDEVLAAVSTHQSDVWAYQFDWAQEPTPWDVVYGAAHGFDLPFLFGSFQPSLLSNMAFSTANAPGRLALSEAMMTSLASFMHAGDPNHAGLGTEWSAWPTQLIFDATLTEAVIYAQAPDEE
ncbi:MAG: carboxylesterase family protein [Anaerolineae bacterium]|nr:carboxylesterase family protein [Anaerolineae bacterium]